MIKHKYKQAVEQLAKAVQSANNRFYTLDGFSQSNEDDSQVQKTIISSLSVERDQLIKDLERCISKLQNLDIPIL